MSAADQRSNRIKERIAASQARLDRESHELPTIPRRQPLPDAYPPEDYRSLAAEYPWLAMAAGMGIGMLAGALLPKGAGSKVGRRVIGAASVAAELGLAFSKQARDRAQEVGREGLEQIDERTAPLRQRAARAGGDARTKSVRLASQAIRLAARLRK